MLTNVDAIHSFAHNGFFCALNDFYVLGIWYFVVCMWQQWKQCQL